MELQKLPASLPEFQSIFPDDDACRDFLISLKWPDGFRCPACGGSEVFDSPERRQRHLMRCRNCKRDVSVTAGTVMHRSRMPLNTWLWAAYLMTTSPVGISALQLQRKLKIKNYEAAWGMLHKLRAAAIDPKRLPLDGDIEVDETAIGGGQLGHVGRDFEGKTIVVAAVERLKRRPNKDGSIPKNRRFFAGRIRLQVIPNTRGGSLIPFVKANIASGSNVITDGWIGYRSLSTKKSGYRHKVYNISKTGNPAHELLPLCHVIFSNLKTWLLGTHHGRPVTKHMQAYLDEYVFRFNRRHYDVIAFRRILGLGMNRLSPTFDDLYADEE